MPVVMIWQLARGLAARGAGVAAELVAAVGYEQHAQAIARWGMVVGGLSFVLSELPERPSAEELRGVCWVLGRELERMGDGTAEFFLALAESGLPDVATLRDSCAEWMEDASTLEAANVIAPVWRLLERLATTEAP